MLDQGYIPLKNAKAVPEEAEKAVAAAEAKTAAAAEAERAAVAEKKTVEEIYRSGKALIDAHHKF